MASLDRFRRSAEHSAERVAKLSFRCFVVGAIGLAVAVAVVVGGSLLEVGAHGNAFLAVIAAAIVGILAALFTWLWSLVLGLRVVRQRRRVLWWLVPEALIIVACTLSVLLAR